MSSAVIDKVPLKFRRLPGGVDLPLPRLMTAGSAGLDLSAAVEQPTVVPPGQIRMIPVGFAVAIPAGFEGQVRPRSGLAAKHGVSLVNSPGTIDSDYRGEVMVPLVNHGLAPFVVERGMRIAQLVICPVPPVEVEEVETLPETSRGAGGFGHTGV